MTVVMVIRAVSLHDRGDERGFRDGACRPISGRDGRPSCSGALSVRPGKTGSQAVNDTLHCLFAESI